MIDRLHSALRSANRWIALLLGWLVLAAVGFVLIDVVMRKMQWGSLGGSDELSGYVMAVVSSWGLGCALVERAHVRIDVLRQQLGRRGRASLDLVAMAVTTAVVTLVAWHCWPVLRKSLDRGSRANTPLETPLWIPQSLWFSGWVWFALSSILLLAIGIAYLMSARQDAFDSAIGLGSELDDAIEEARLAHEERA